MKIRFVRSSDVGYPRKYMTRPYFLKLGSGLNAIYCVTVGKYWIDFSFNNKCL